MEENRNDLPANPSPEGPKLVRGRFGKWLDNYWYHYKWHTLIALFIIITVIVCSLQMCTKERYDIHVLYAGNKYIDHTSDDGDIPEYKSILSALKLGAEDFDGDGEVTVAFADKYALSSEDLAKLDESEKINKQSLLQTHSKEISEIMGYGDYYLCFLSPAVYEQYRGIKEVQRFSNLRGYAEGLSDESFYSDTAIYLSSLDFYNQPGINLLPSDTLVCLRSRTEVMKDNNSKKQFERSEQMLINILAFGKD